MELAIEWQQWLLWPVECEYVVCCLYSCAKFCVWHAGGVLDGYGSNYI